MGLAYDDQVSPDFWPSPARYFFARSPARSFSLFCLSSSYFIALWTRMKRATGTMSLADLVGQRVQVRGAFWPDFLTVSGGA